MFYNPSFVRKKDGAETKAQRSRFLLNFIMGNPEGYKIHFIIAWASINIGLYLS